VANPDLPPTERRDLATLVEPAHKPRNSAAALWTIVGWTLMLGGAFVAIWIGKALSGGPGGIIAELILGGGAGTVLGLATAKSLIRAKRLGAPSALEILATDRRKPVVYLRPFSADADASSPVSLTSWFTEEEQLAKMMNDIGPLVAIGEPNEPLPDIGASRVYAAEPRWRDAVIELVDRAAIVIMRAGISPGFQWEIGTVIQRVRPTQLVLLIPRNEPLYESFRARARDLLPAVLPTLTGWDVKARFRGGLKAVVLFDEHWTPSVVDLQTYRVPFLKRSPAMPIVPVLKSALRTVYESAGVRWSPPGINGRMVGAIAAVLLLVLSQVFAWSASHDFGGSLFAGSPTYARDTTTQAPPPRSHADVALARFSARLQSLPEMVRILDSIRRSAGSDDAAQERARAETRNVGAVLARRGIKRLDDESLLTMGALNARLLEVADVASCAAMARGAPGDGVMRALALLDSADVDRFFELTYLATAAEARGAPPAREPNEKRLEETMAQIIATSPTENRERLTRALNDSVADAEMCWAGRTLNAGIQRLPRRDQVQWVLAR
jgi:hypothetical protein